MFHRDAPAIDPEFERSGDVLEWLAHPDERGQRASHAIVGADGVWVVDPIDVPGLDDRLAELGEVAGVLVCSRMHARDAGTIARRHDVTVHVPTGFDRVPERVDAPFTWAARLPDDEIRLERLGVVSGWDEATLTFDDALYVPELFGTAPMHTVGEERVGVYLFARPLLSRLSMPQTDPERLFFGHGRAITEDATSALDDALHGGRRRFPKALVTQGPEQLRAVWRSVVVD